MALASSPSRSSGSELELEEDRFDFSGSFGCWRGSEVSDPAGRKACEAGLGASAAGLGAASTGITTGGLGAAATRRHRLRPESDELELELESELSESEKPGDLTRVERIAA
jgi:hypothetical protein